MIFFSLESIIFVKLQQMKKTNEQTKIHVFSIYDVFNQFQK